MGWVHPLVRHEVARPRDVAQGRDHQVAARVGVAVEDDEAGGPAVEDQRLLVGLREHPAEHASGRLLGRADVLEPPGCPEALQRGRRLAQPPVGEALPGPA